MQARDYLITGVGTMQQIDRKSFDSHERAMGAVISRRAALGASGVAALGLLAGAGYAQEERQVEREGSDANRRKEMQDRMEEFKAYAERMQNASPEERMKIMQEQRVQQQQKAIEDLKGQLEISDKEWPVVKPRVEKVYDLVHPLSQMGTRSEQPRTEVDKASGELRELLRNESAAADQIKAKLAALRAAKQKAAQDLATARQSLRRLMTLRQEALLVLNGLLD
jgi:chromosome segregation ATPase